MTIIYNNKKVKYWCHQLLLWYQMINCVSSFIHFQGCVLWWPMEPPWGHPNVSLTIISTSKQCTLVFTKMYSSLNILINLWLQQQCLQQQQRRRQGQLRQQRLLQHPQQQGLHWHILYFRLKIMTINKWNRLRQCLMIKYLMQMILR